jgi:hypothetical protein
MGLFSSLQNKISYAISYLLIEVLLLSVVETLSPTNLAGPGLDILFILFYLILTPILFFKTLSNAFKNQNYWIPSIYLVAVGFLVVFNIYSYKFRDLRIHFTFHRRSIRAQPVYHLLQVKRPRLTFLHSHEIAASFLLAMTNRKAVTQKH